jgi:hypothetical protein
MINFISKKLVKSPLKSTLLMVLLIALFVACAGEKKAETKITYRSKIFTEQFLIDYLNENRDLNSDDSLTFANALDKFQRDIKGVSNNPDFLVDFPLQATNIRDTIMGTQSFKMATFETYTDPLRDKNGLLNKIQLRVNGIFQFPYQAYGLSLGGKYYLKAMIYKQGKRKDVNFYRKDGGSVYNLGVYPMAVKELKPIVSKQQMASLN